MPYVPLEKLIDKTNYSIYTLVVLASKRAFEIAEGAAVLVERKDNAKPGSIALEEIAQGKIRLKGSKKEKD
jgi:DNA-directed RNA polymerase omega subunit